MRVSEGVRVARRLHRLYPTMSARLILETIAARDGVAIDRYPLHRSVAGLVLYISGKPVVALNSGHPDERQLFSLAHELGHVLLGHRAGWLTADAPLADDPADEREANAFAAEFLMPAQSVAEWATQGRTATQMSEDFGVSREAMGRRLNELGLRSAGKAQRQPTGTTGRAQLSTGVTDRRGDSISR